MPRRIEGVTGGKHAVKNEIWFCTFIMYMCSKGNEPDLVDLNSLHSGFRLDIRYATVNNFVRVAVYKTARAILQRPAAEALVRVAKRLESEG